LAEYLQFSSIGQERQLVAEPAAVGFLDLLKYCNDPEDETVIGRWGGFVEFGGAEHNSHKSTSIS
jgi:hypothetical protein